MMPALGQCILSRAPLTIGVSICRRYYNQDYWERFTYHLILESLEFVCNIPSQEIADKVRPSGSVSGHQVEDKFAHIGLTPIPALCVSAPLIAECPVNFECLVKQILNVGSHDMFIGEVVMIHTDEEIASDRKRLIWTDLPAVAAPEEGV